jgi:hypothetical protein
MRNGLLSACLVLCATLSGAATCMPLPETPQAAESDVAAAIPETLRAAIESAELDGVELYREDTAAWLASDALVEKKLRKKHKKKTSGWIARETDPPSQWTVSYIETSSGSPKIYADVRVEFSGSKPRTDVVAYDPPRPATEAEASLISARDRALGMEWLRCSSQYNHATQQVVVDGDTYFDVRLLPARLDNVTFPLGGYHRFRLGPNGDVEHFAQTKGCVESRARPDSAASELKGFMVSHLTSDTPTEFHVFMSLSYKNPVYVLTVNNKLVWHVERGHIRLVGDTKKESQ